MNKKTVSLFITEVTARLTGDDSTVFAVKNSRKAESAINSQLAAQNAALVDAEDKVEEAKENLAAAQFPTELIVSSKIYIDNILLAEKELQANQTALEELQESIQYLETLRDTMFKVVTEK